MLQMELGEVLSIHGTAWHWQQDVLLLLGTALGTRAGAGGAWREGGSSAPPALLRARLDG